MPRFQNKPLRTDAIMVRTSSDSSVLARNVTLHTAQALRKAHDNPNWILSGNAALADVPRQIAQLPYVQFHKAFRLPDENLDTPLETHDCVVEISTHRFWVRALYSPSAPVNGALRDLCASAKLPPWRGEIIVIALGKKTPFLKAVSPMKACDALVKFMRIFRRRLRDHKPFPTTLRA
ncbi:hypothetical protein GGX14DRAFT_400496 [Mycena pura]|uniref:Uncharacterized protein n=1 Tax=Mycena pura TaxID=153505 RepID=A0AAD6Y9L2_9AGAR|nr:hypothetical protein GGX14DRAFT_400496 [Mycena pura]